MTTNLGLLKVALGIIINQKRQVLLCSTKNNIWGFPGGKLEPGENSYQALYRELVEEVNIQVISAVPLTSVYYDYKTYQVQLYPWKVTEYSGDPTDMENQYLSWVDIDQLPSINIFAANKAVVQEIIDLETTTS